MTPAITFAPIAMGRLAVMLGRVQVGEIMPIGGRHQACFKVALPEAASCAWRPARDLDEAKKLARCAIGDWLAAAGLREGA